ncbi:MAG: 3-isopropylmalate dehydratase small subunit [Candidatus Omnitrophota bacterium]
MVLKGKVYKYGSNVNTDEIIPARYLNTSEAAELAKHCMEDIDPDFAKSVKKGDIIAANKNFGCGSSREHAPLSIKAAGVSCVIAESFARIFYRNAINIGLPILECKKSREIKKGDVLEIDLGQGRIMNISQNKNYSALAYPPFMQELINSGGLMKWIRGRCCRAKR